MAWSRIYSNQAVDSNLTGVIDNAFPLPRYKCHVQYAFSVRSAGLAGLMYVTLKWKDRAGNARSVSSPAIALTSVGAGAERTINIHTEDNEDTNVELEVTTVGALGSFKYDYWMTIEADQESL